MDSSNSDNTVSVNMTSPISNEPVKGNNALYIHYNNYFVISEYYFFLAQLVESKIDPSGVQLVNPYRTNKVDSLDLVALAKEIQTVSIRSFLF